MQCPKCQHVAVEKAAKFCSQCGTLLEAQPCVKKKDETPEKQAVTQQSTNEEMPEVEPTSPAGQQTSVSPKRPNDDISTKPPKKKKRKKKKNKKRISVEGEPVSLTSDLSYISLTEKGKEAEQEDDEAMLSESEESTCAVDETHNSLSDTPATCENKGDIPGCGPEAEATCNEKPPHGTSLHEAGSRNNNAAVEEDESSCLDSEQKSQSTQEPTQSTDMDIHCENLLSSSQTTSKTPPQVSEQKTSNTGPVSDKGASKKTQVSLDQNANVKEYAKVEGNQNKQMPSKVENEKKEKNKSPDHQSGKIFGQQTKTKTKHESSSVDPQVNEECDQHQQSPDHQSGKTFGQQTKAKTKHESSSVDPQVNEECDKHKQSAHSMGDTSTGSSAQSKKNATNQESNTKKDSPSNRVPASSQQLSSSERLTIYFHAVLSKDFKFYPNEDHVFIRAGHHIGDWEQNLVELSVSRDLGEHGFLLEGKLVSTKTKAEAVSIPYKYVVYRTKKDKYDFEYIYKLDSNEMTNRCLFVKPHLLNEGEWHQYDDIICAQPSKSMFQKLKKALWFEQRKSVIQGREIAGKFMLETIFDLLTDWNDINFKSFISQLKQFYEVYGNPYVYEETYKKWTSLDYSEKDVSNLLKRFMLDCVTPGVQKDGAGKSSFIKETLKAAIILLYVWKQYKLTLDRGELVRLCTALSLPNLPREEFLAFWSNIEQSFSSLKNIPEILLDLMNMVKSEGMTRWIIVIPLLHFLKGTSRPFESVSHTGTSRNEQSWAGLEGLKLASVHSLSSQDRRSMLNLIKLNPHMVEMDRLLPRSWMYLLTVDELVDCSNIIHVDLLDMLQIFTMKAPVDISFSSSTSVSNTLTLIQSQLLEQRYSCASDDYGLECLKSAVKLLEKMCKGVKSSYVQDALDIPVACLNLVVSVLEFSRSLSAQDEQGRDSANLKILELLSVTQKTVRTWIGQTYKGRLVNKYTLSMSVSLASEIDMWNNIISISFENKDFTKEWRDTFTRDFEGKFQQETALDQIEVYCNKIEELNNSHPHVARSIEKCALQAVTSMCQAKNEGRLFDRIKINWKFGKLISAIIQKSWPRNESGSYEEGEEVVLQHLLNWTAATNIFQLHGADEKLINELSDEAKERLAVATSFITDISNKFIVGSIKIKVLNHILAKKDTFIELIKIDSLCENEQCKDTSAMKRLLQSRQKEVKEVYHQSELVEGLMAMYRKLQEHVTVYSENLEVKHQIDIDEMKLDTFMEVHQFNQIPSPMVGVVTYFELDKDVQSMAETLHKFKDSYIFKVCLESQAKNYAKLSNDESESEEANADLWVPPDVIYSDIFVPCYYKYQTIYESVKNGYMTFEDVEVIFKVYRGRYQELGEDLEIMCKLDAANDKRWIQTRVQQIEQYHELHLAVESAQIVMTVKQTLCSQGDFQVLEKLLELTHLDFRKERLDSIDNELMHAKTVLVDITEPRRLCLQELSLRKNFVMWVKESLEDINELKVFVDLASISAGENDLDVDRVACFHDAVLGYSSMLYELKPDAGFLAFKEVLKKLWKALDNDPNLPKKLRDTARHLEWLKTVKDSHGSVELSSLSLASAVNKKGVYTISAECQKKLSLDKVLKLQIPETHDEGLEIRCYTLEDLRELQNKLMLMSGKGDQGQNEVDQFAEVFAGVQRLAAAFIDLFAAGNPLFRHWEANINCNSKEACIVMDFKLGSLVSVVMVEGDLAEELPEVCKKMERCLDFWKNFMDKQRSQFYYLNYFTAEQIVYLCNQLAQNNTVNLEDQALMMLSFIKANCSPSDLREAWHVLQYEMLTNPPKQNEDLDFQTFPEPLSEQINSDMNEEEYSFDQMPFPLIPESEPERLDAIWNAYMRDMKNFFPNTLDVRSLGRLLEILANSSSETEDDSEADSTIKRELPKGLFLGKPNLIVCPRTEILTCCISVYMSRENEPLPTYDEVLLCVPDTPYEQVELFLRRCLTAGYRGEKIYTMLYIDQLTYEVSYKVEQFFQRHRAQSRNDYRLVLICGSDREHAYLPSVFSQFRLHIVPQEPTSRIQRYLDMHYQVPHGTSSAAAVFKNKKSVGVVSSKRAGVGKSLYIRRMYEKLKKITKKPSHLKCIRLIEPRVDENAILQSMINSPRKELTIFHFDVTSSVKKDLHEFLFKLLILGHLLDSEGRMWKCSSRHLYVVEILLSERDAPRNGPKACSNAQCAFLNVFPSVYCRDPKEVLDLEVRMLVDSSIAKIDDPLMDDEEFRSAAYQRPYQYLKRFHIGANLDGFVYQGTEGSHVECLQMLFVYCGIRDPSWAELRNFTWFLNLQLQDCETSVFCDASFTGDTLLGFKNFVVDFMILMAKDFATPSLSISDQSPGMLQMDFSGVNEEDLAPFRIRKRWESEPHPYIFFNDDHVSMTFIGFHLQLNDQNLVDAIDPSTNRVIKKNIMTKQLYDGLMLQRVPFNIDFDKLHRGEKIERLCRVLGIQWPLDPDETYELTTDNILKILAIHMRFRCGIPVIIMGETGCGKTRLIKFLCELQRSGVGTENLKLVKVHGGTSSDMIYTKVREAETMAFLNKQDYGFDSVLFFDEANTTEAVSSIKEVLCDNTVEGESMVRHSGLKIIAACNPYRKHTNIMIKRLESAGLGYRVRAEETDEKLGSIPLRQLVYRVHALPPSMIPLVWDFGQLNDRTEKMYIQQIVQRVVENHNFPEDYIKIITDVLSASQNYMRKRQDECSFVSLRDVERCMQVFAWFYQNNEMLLFELARYESGQNPQRNEQEDVVERNPILWSLVMAIGVCYHACLEAKEKYRVRICRYFPEAYTPVKLMQEITAMQDFLLSGVPLGDTIARNSALKENVFMMVICIELRIPLFLVGKPGSSKSLSKTLVADAMQGQAAHSDLYRKLKQIHLVSFQCSPHSTPEGIINTFKQCARFQEGKNLNEYISVVVLDEIGLAEDSPKMPLKTLHPLLEEGCIDDQPLPHKKVGFIGISNWALDPAKMNRGIFVSRGDPDEKELTESAKGICSSDPMILEKVRDFFQPFAKAYLNICKKQGRGFFGLRDYYSLIKMMFATAKASEQRPSAEQIVEAVLRNFSGKDNVSAVTVFTSEIQLKPNLDSINTIDLVRQNITAIGQDEECRYLLILTKNYAALKILQQTFFSEEYQPEIIFGSSFPKDQEYTQICRNINRVKVCMETGQTIVLLNLQNLYESLYDALNQYYVCLGGQKYVDLGLGTHRVKCRVHKDFRLIVIEEKEIVYNQFPIPLINRLEKHYLDINTVLKYEQMELVRELEKWVEQFIALKSQHSLAVHAHKFDPADVFVGHHSDTCASIILQVTERQKGEVEVSDPHRHVLDEAKLILLNCSTPDAVVRLDGTALSRVESEHLARVYFEDQKHCSLVDFVLSHIQHEECSSVSFTEVTTFSRLLTTVDIEHLQEVVPNIELVALQQFDTEHSFLKKIKHFLDSTSGNKILIIQTNFDEDFKSSNLIASAKYSSINEINKFRNDEEKVFVYFITKLPRMEGGTSYVGFHGGPWKSIHIDDLRRSKDIVSDIKALQCLTISQLFEEKEDQSEAMETEEIYNEMETEKMEQEDSSRWENVLDTTMLVRSCVQRAVGMLGDQGESGSRSTRRVEILLTLLTDGEDLQAAFLKIVKRHLHSLLMIHDEHTVSAKNWVFKEASNIDALQEGGTFRHTLWKRVQAVVIPFLAQLISIIDRNHNLDLLLDENSGESVKKLWLEIFGNVKLLQVPYTRVDPNSMTIVVQNCIAVDKNMGCMMPFSWRIRDYLDELWVHALHREGHSQKQFDKFFWRTPLGRYIANAEDEMQIEFFHRYLQDFISLTMKISSDVELQLLTTALTCCVYELRGRQEAVENDKVSLAWVHAAYYEFKNRLQNLLRMITIEPQIAQVLLGNMQSTVGVEMVLDVYAAMACVEYLEPQTLDSSSQSLSWLRLVKKLQVPVELVCSEESYRHYGERSKAMVTNVQHGWQRIFSLSLFVEHILLAVDDKEQQLKPLVLEHTRRLAQVLNENSNLKMNQPFEAVITILKTCKNGANERIFRFGFQPCPVCMGDPKDPVKLFCDHIYCLTCIRQWLCPGQMYCPLCMQGVEDDFRLMPSDEIRILISRITTFRKQCNAFFIDLVSTVCFRGNSPPSRNIILHLLSLLMVEACSVPMVRGRDRHFLTKALSPFDESMDKNPVVRSVVLKLLLKYSFDDVKDYLQQHLTSVERNNILEKTDKTELYCLYINCLEDSMFERIQWHSVAEQHACLLEERNFLLEMLQSAAVSSHTATIQHLQQVARTRLCLDVAAGLLVSRNTPVVNQEETPNGVSAFLNSVKDLCERSGNNWYRVYLIRKICSLNGVEYVQKLLCKGHLKWMFPQEVFQMNQDGSQIDQYLACGLEYKTIRDAVAKAMLEGKMELIEKACEACQCTPAKKTVYLLLALFREVTSLYRSNNPNIHPTLEKLAALDDLIKESGVFINQNSRNFAQMLVQNEPGALQVQPNMSDKNQTVVEISVHLAAVLLCVNEVPPQPLRQLALSPNNMERSFIPTMPDDMFAVAQQALATAGPLQWYFCPNGHPCTVGECGQPMERSRCPDCNVEIGGTDHRPVQGFRVVAIHGDRTQAGHILGDPKRREQPDMQDTKSMSPAPFALLRMLTHMAMLLGTSSNPQAIGAIIRPAVADPGVFLMAHLLKDMEQLSRALGKGADDTVCTVHLTICSLLEPHQPSHGPVLYDHLLSTKECRNNWETAMNTDIITQQLKVLDRQLLNVNDIIRKDERVSSNPVMKLTFGEPQQFLPSLPQDSLIHTLAVWSCRERVSLLSLAHIVEQNDGKDTLPILWKFLHREAELRMVKFLPDILALQRDLVKKFQNVMELPCNTIAEFLKSQKADSLKASYEKQIKIFLSTWNQLRVSLTTNGEIKLPAEYCQKDMDFSTDLQVLLPRRQGLGLCSTALVSYLIALHNELVYTVEKHTGEETSYSVSPADLTELHVIHYEVERDILPLVLSNCQYSMERGRETLSEYDLPKIQQQILTRFLQGKPLITLNGIPTLVNRHDRNYENIFKDIKAKVKQEPLSSLSQSTLALELQSFSDVCEALSTVELVLGFLAMTGGEAHMQLGSYLKEVLQMADHTAPHIFKALSRCSLKHCVALWQLLTSLKSETMLRLKRDPFLGISKEYKHALDEEEKQLLTGFFTKTSADCFLLEMHEFLLLVLKNARATDTYKPNWSIKDTVISYMERKDLDIPPDVELLFPGDILLAKYIEAWKFSVTLRNERNQR